MPALCIEGEKRSSLRWRALDRRSRSSRDKQSGSGKVCIASWRGGDIRSHRGSPGMIPLDTSGSILHCMKLFLPMRRAKEGYLHKKNLHPEHDNLKPQKQSSSLITTSTTKEIAFSSDQTLQAQNKRIFDMPCRAQEAQYFSLFDIRQWLLADGQRRFIAD